MVEQALGLAEAIVLNEAAAPNMDLSVAFHGSAGGRDRLDLGRVIISERQLT
jgi:hypothetical protein